MHILRQYIIFHPEVRVFHRQRSFSPLLEWNTVHFLSFYFKQLPWNFSGCWLAIIRSFKLFSFPENALVHSVFWCSFLRLRKCNQQVFSKTCKVSPRICIFWIELIIQHCHCWCFLHGDHLQWLNSDLEKEGEGEKQRVPVASVQGWLNVNFGFPDPTWESAADISRENNPPSAGMEPGLSISF